MSTKQRVVYETDGGSDEREFNIKIIFTFKGIIGGYTESII